MICWPVKIITHDYFYPHITKCKLDLNVTSYETIVLVSATIDKKSPLAHVHAYTQSKRKF